MRNLINKVLAMITTTAGKGSKGLIRIPTPRSSDVSSRAIWRCGDDAEGWFQRPLIVGASTHHHYQRRRLFRCSAWECVCVWCYVCLDRSLASGPCWLRCSSKPDDDDISFLREYCSAALGRSVELQWYRVCRGNSWIFIKSWVTYSGCCANFATAADDSWKFLTSLYSLSTILVLWNYKGTLSGKLYDRVSFKLIPAPLLNESHNAAALLIPLIPRISANPPQDFKQQSRVEEKVQPGSDTGSANEQMHMPNSFKVRPKKRN